MTSYNTAYKTAACEATRTIRPSVTQWGPVPAHIAAAWCDADRAYDGAGCDMPEGGLTAAEEWALQFDEWTH